MSGSERTTRRPSIGFVGAGRAGSALASAFAAAGCPVPAVHSRTEQHARTLATAVGAIVCESSVEVLRLSEVVFLTVPDRAIAGVAAKLAAAEVESRARLVLHCSGALERAVLAPVEEKGWATGVFHPLQALAGSVSAPRLRGCYVGVEAAPERLGRLFELADAIGAHAVEVRLEARLPYHIAAVVASNYTVVLLDVAASLLSDAGFPKPEASRMLLPLVEGALANLKESTAREAMTGPIARGDAATVVRHLDYLRGRRPDVYELYRTLGMKALGVVGAEDSAEMREALS